MDAQLEFDAKYVSSFEVCRTFDITRATLVMWRRKGKLPEPIRIYRTDGPALIMLWLRTELQAHIASLPTPLQKTA